MARRGGSCRHCWTWRLRGDHWYVIWCPHCGWYRTEEYFMEDVDLLARMVEESETNHRVHCHEYRYRKASVMALPGGHDE